MIPTPEQQVLLTRPMVLVWRCPNCPETHARKGTWVDITKAAMIVAQQPGPVCVLIQDATSYEIENADLAAELEGIKP